MPSCALCCGGLVEVELQRDCPNLEQHVAYKNVKLRKELESMTEEMPMPEPEDVEALMAESPDAPATTVENPMATGEDPRVDSIVDGEIIPATFEPAPPAMEVTTDAVTGEMTVEEVKPDDSGTNASVLKKEVESVNLEIRRPSTPLEISVEEYMEIYNKQIKDLAGLMKEKFQELGPEAGKLAVAEAISTQIHGLLQLISVSRIQWYAAHNTFGRLLKELDESAAKKYKAKAEGTPRKRPETVMAKHEPKSRKKAPKDPIQAAMETLIEMGYTEEQARAHIANSPLGKGEK